MRVTSSRAYARPPPVPKMPDGLVELMHGLSREVLKNNPTDVYSFCANHMEKLLELRDGPPPARPLTLEEKIAKAQEIVRQRAKERREKFDKEYKLQFNKNFDEACKEEVTNKSNANNKVKQNVPSLKDPVHHEDDLEHESEIEISHTKQDRENLANNSHMFAKLTSPDNVHDGIENLEDLKNYVEADDKSDNRPISDKPENGTEEIKNANHLGDDKIECNAEEEKLENLLSEDEGPICLVDNKQEDHLLHDEHELNILTTDEKAANQSEDDKLENLKNDNKLENPNKHFPDDKPNLATNDKPESHSPDDKPETRQENLGTDEKSENLASDYKPENHSADVKSENLATNNTPENHSANKKTENIATAKTENHTVDIKSENLATDKPENQSADVMSEYFATDKPENHSADVKSENSATDKPENQSTDVMSEYSATDKPENHSADVKSEDLATDKPESHFSDEKPDNLTENDLPQNHSANDKPNNHGTDSKPENISIHVDPETFTTNNNLENNSAYKKPDNLVNDDKTENRSAADKPENENHASDDKPGKHSADNLAIDSNPKNHATDDKPEDLATDSKTENNSADNNSENPTPHNKPDHSVHDKPENLATGEDPENHSVKFKSENHVLNEENLGALNTLENHNADNIMNNKQGDDTKNLAVDNKDENLSADVKSSVGDVSHPPDDKSENTSAHDASHGAAEDKLPNLAQGEYCAYKNNSENQASADNPGNDLSDDKYLTHKPADDNDELKSGNCLVDDKPKTQADIKEKNNTVDNVNANHVPDNEPESRAVNVTSVNHSVDDKSGKHLTDNVTKNDAKPLNDIENILASTDNNSVKKLETRGNEPKDNKILEKVLGEVPKVIMHHRQTIENHVHMPSDSHLQTIAESPIENLDEINEVVPKLAHIPEVTITESQPETEKTVTNIPILNDNEKSDFEKPIETLNKVSLNSNKPVEPINENSYFINEKPSDVIKIEITVPDDPITQSDANNSVVVNNKSEILKNQELCNDKEQAQKETKGDEKYQEVHNILVNGIVSVKEDNLVLSEPILPNSGLSTDTNVVANLQSDNTDKDNDENIIKDLKCDTTENPNEIGAKTPTNKEVNYCGEKHDSLDNALLSMTDSTGNNTAEDNSVAETESLKTDDDSAANANMDLETAAVTIQKVFRSFMFKSRNSTFDDTVPDDNNSIDVDEESSEKKDEYYAAASMNKERRPLGITRMDTVLQTVNEEKSLSLSTDDSSTLSSAATTIQAHVRGFLVRNRMNSNKTMSTSSLVNSHEVLEFDPEQQKNKTVLNIHIVPEQGNYFSRDESFITSMDLSLDGSPPSSVNLHPLSYDISERRKMLKREDAVQSVSPPSNNSGKLSEESVKEVLINDSDVLEIDLSDDRIKSEEEQTNDLDNDASDLISDSSATPITEIHVYKNEDPIVSPMPEEVLQCNEANLIKMNSDEADVITPYVPSPRPKSENGCKLVHSGEFHDVALPTKVSRNDTSVVREFKNVLVYFLLWNNS